MELVRPKRKNRAERPKENTRFEMRAGNPRAAKRSAFADKKFRHRRAHFQAFFPGRLFFADHEIQSCAWSVNRDVFDLDVRANSHYDFPKAAERAIHSRRYDFLFHLSTLYEGNRTRAPLEQPCGDGIFFALELYRRDIRLCDYTCAGVQMPEFGDAVFHKQSNQLLVHRMRTSFRDNVLNLSEF